MPVHPRSTSSGRITHGPDSTLAEQTIEFVHGQLHAWRDDETRPAVEAEEDLNGQLCKYLNDRARDDFPMALFQTEEPQGNRRRVDLAVMPSSKAIKAALYEDIYRPFLVMEGKRLPAPDKDREREYLTGMDKKSGGIQRFRLCLHGKSLSAAVMIGYVQSGEAAQWREVINRWVADLAASGGDSTCVWSDRDQLGKLTHKGRAKAAKCESTHARIDGVADVRLVHLWVCMSKKQRGKAGKEGAEEQASTN